MVLSPLNILIIAFLLVEAGLLAYNLLRRRTDTERLTWLSAAIITALFVTGLQLLPPDWQFSETLNRSFVIWLALELNLIAFAGMIVRDIARDDNAPRFRRLWLGISVLWLIAFAGAALLLQEPFAGWTDWIDGGSSVIALVGLGGAALLGTHMLTVTFYYFYVAPMPEVANRSAFWLASSAVMLVAVVLLSSSSNPLMLPGNVILITALLIATYGIRHYRLIDIRTALLGLARTIAITGMTWMLTFAALYLVDRANFFTELSIPSIPDGTSGTLIIASIALTIAVLIVPVRQVIEMFFRELNPRSRTNVAGATAQYSQRVARAASLEEVVEATTSTINDVMNVRRSALVLINNTFRVPDSVELIVLSGGATLNNPTSTGYLSKSSPIYRSLSMEKVPVGQFDIEFGPAYQEASDDERAFFRGLGMSAYVPVMTDARLIGLLASGPKLNDMPYYREDVELLTVIGQQVGTALRSARLIDDLQHLNDSMRVLNKRLENAKMELEKLDTIKTDFITIASHELRTPLAQIRGYTDIMDSLNEADSLQQEQARQMVNNLRKSTGRMEELISAMLDVSQIDVNSMDLRFIRTTPETIIRMALEPLKDPAEQRDIQIERSGLQGLPHIEADLQRMTQAFRNIILNAIKFTPDGGTITIRADYKEPGDGDKSIEHVLFTIEDTGVGIAEKDIKYIFQKFYRGFDTQLHSSGIYKFMGAGPGLGLTIARGIIEGHGGEIWAQSPGHDMDDLPGSTFFVRLPLHPPEGTRRVQPFEGDGEARISTEEPKRRETDTRPMPEGVIDQARRESEAEARDDFNVNTRIPPDRYT
jgi:signal transduction histidine kinase